jgi:hypothetical protein
MNISLNLENLSGSVYDSFGIEHPFGITLGIGYNLNLDTP